MTIKIPLSLSGPADEFAKAVDAHRKACHVHMMGRTGRPAPVAPDVVAAVVTRVPQTGPVDKRGPDEIVILPYEIIDDRKVSPEVQLLRDSINQGA
jgi:hypothetical protein